MILFFFSNISRFKHWNIVIFIGLLTFSASIIIKLRLSLEELLEVEKCPACYGLSACEFIRRIDITPRNIFSLFFYLFHEKNVFIGTYDEKTIILKKLASFSELQEFDRALCEKKKFKFLCKNNEQNKDNDRIIQDVDFYKLIKEKIKCDFTQDDQSRLRLCPNDMHFSLLFSNVHSNFEIIDSKDFIIHLWTLVTINPEPLLLQILPADQGWPFPKYLGSCGRIIAEEYVGLPISAYYYASWIFRAKIISSLLHAAYILTFRHEHFGFYLTDISADNIAVTPDGTAKFIDAENVIIVDKNISQEEKSTIWHEVQENQENFDCSNCFAFAPVDICEHQFSDHNYYAICQVLLSPKTIEDSIPNGFLHDIPPDILKQYPSLKCLIEQCFNYDRLQNRISKGQQLKKLLDAILQGIYNFTKYFLILELSFYNIKLRGRNTIDEGEIILLTMKLMNH